MNVNEYGVQFLFGTSYDLSGYTSLELTFTKPDGSTLVKTNPDVSVGNVTVATVLGSFAANTYVVYQWLNGDVDQAGQWCVQLVYDDAGKHLISDAGHFTIAQPTC